MSVELESNRFITGKSVVRDLCLRERDFVQANRMWYLGVLRDAYNRLNIKSAMFTIRVALPVIRTGSVPYVNTPSDYLELSSIAAENDYGKLAPMIINSNIKTDVADLSLVEKCSCNACNCDGHLCSPVRNFETIYGTQDAEMPDGSTKAFKTLYRKVLMADGSYLEEKTVPAKKFVNNVHTDTVLETESLVLCSLEIEACGCVKNTEDNRKKIDHHCHAVDHQFECGCGVRKHDIDHLHGTYNIEEDGSRIYLPSHFRHDYIVLRYFANSKTKDIIIPYLAKEPLMSSIKELTSNFDPKAGAGEKLFWAGDFKKKYDRFLEDLYPVTLINFYHKMFPRKR